MPDKPACLNKTIIARSKLFQIEQLDLEFSNGQRREYERIVGAAYGAVLIIAIDDKGDTYLVREYAAGTDCYELGFPKGIIDPGESAIDAANRELQEEIGLAATELQVVKSVSLAPGYFKAKLDIVLAKGLYDSVLTGDEPEPLEIVKWPLNDIDGLLMQSDFTEARSVAALLLVNHLIKGEKL